MHLEEVPLDGRASILLRYVDQRGFSHSGRASARLFFGLGREPTLEQMRALADRYPVFLIELLEHGARVEAWQGSG